MIDRLVDRLNEGEVIPDEDLGGVDLGTSGWSAEIEKIIVASAGKPGQGLLKRIDPEIFKKSVPTVTSLPINFGLFPALGDFDFENAQNSLLGLIGSDINDSLKRQVFQIYLCFWLYHGTDAKYKSRYWRICQNKLAGFSFEKKIEINRTIYWDATNEQWERFIKFNKLTITEGGPPQENGENIFAPTTIIKQVIKSKKQTLDKIEYYSHILNVFNNSKKVYRGDVGLQPKGSITDLVDATSRLIRWNNNDLNDENNYGERLLTETSIGLTIGGELNPKTLKWLSGQEYVKKTNEFSGSKNEPSKITSKFLVAITPGIWEKYSDINVGFYKKILDKTQKETRELISGVIMGLHDAFSPNDIMDIVMKSLPWERVWIGVGGTRKHGKMGAMVGAYIKKVIVSVQNIELEREDDPPKKVNTKAKLRSKEEVIAMLKKEVFSLNN